MAAARVRFGIVSGTLAAAVTAALLWLAPVVHGQAVVVQDRDGQPDVIRHLEVLGGRGSAIGVSIRDVEAADLQKHSLSKAAGVIVEDVADGSPAEKAGFKRGDVILGYDGETVRGARQFARLVEETPAGREVTASVRRAGSMTDVQVTPEASSARFAWRGDAPGSFRAMPGFPAAPVVPDLPEMDRLPFEWNRSMGQGTLGVGVQDLGGDLAEYFGVQDGVLVNSVRADSPAAKAGVKPGDVITAVNGSAVDSASELRRRLRETESGDLTLSVTRDRKPLSLKATIEPPERSTARRPRWTA